MKRNSLFLLPIILLAVFLSTKTTLQANAASPESTSVASDSVENPNILGVTVGPTSGIRGVVVKTITPGSPCEGVLKLGDKIFAFDLLDASGKRVDGAKVNAGNFSEAVSKIQPGMTVKLLLDPRLFRMVSVVIPADVRPLPSSTPSAVSPKQ